jgi:hypothetical protein
MRKFPKAPKGMLRIVEYEVDPRDIEDMLRGKRRRRPRPPINVKCHDISREDHERILRRMGIDLSSVKDDEGERS